MIDDVAHIAAMRRLQDVMVSIATPPKDWTAVHSALLEMALSNGDTAMVCQLTDKLEMSAQLSRLHVGYQAALTSLQNASKLIKASKVRLSRSTLLR